ncbi:MAG: segregation/condensation protein A, partial [Deltaproteobacteria bacterium]|nr:segregation/condensation protein A [Deltaproteobacteria bacterium]
AKDYVPAAESGHELYQLHLEGFEGPLDLLLFLIRRHALDIFDIPVAFICQQYLAYLRRMEELNLDVASEFLATAAELLHIKSKMLLPKPAEVSDEEEADPRAELVRRLLEYQKYRDAALWLGGTTWQGRDTFAHDEETAEAPAGERSLREVGVFALIEAFGTVLARQAPELRHQVLLEQVRVSDCIRGFIDLLAQRARLRFDELVGASRDRLDVVVSFLALLEMTRLRLLKLYQSPEGTLYLERRFASIEQALHQLERIEQEQAEPRAPEVR